MKKQKIMKWALPALLMSAMTFELMPGSVLYFAKDLVATPESVGYNFFTVEAESVAASCLPIAGVVTFGMLVLALVAACFKKDGLYKLISWGSLAAAALAAAPYFTVSENEFVQPNAMTILILTACWILTVVIDKQKKSVKEEYKGRRL